MAQLKEKSAAPTARLRFIDGIRGLAVLMVVYFHAVVWGGFPVEGLGQFYLFDGAIPIELGRLRHILSVGGAGVDLFLAISGFCLFWPLVKETSIRSRELHVAHYLKRRIWRICPPYYFGLASVFLCSYLTYLYEGRTWWPWAPNSFQNAFPWNGSDSWLNLASHLLLIHGFFNSYINAYEGAYWSLSLEWQFYFLFIPLAYVGRRWGIVWAFIIPIVVTILFRNISAQLFPEFFNTAVGQLFSLSRWVEFGAGMAAAAAVSGALPNNRLKETFVGLHNLRGLYLIASLLLAVVVEYLRAPAELIPYAWGNASFALITNAATAGSTLRRIFEWKPLVWVGTISYSLYLTHGMVYMAMALLLTNTSISRDVRQAIYLFLGPLIAIAFSAVFFQLVEKPFLSGITRRRQPGGAIEKEKTATVADQAMP